MNIATLIVPNRIIEVVCAIKHKWLHGITLEIHLPLLATFRKHKAVRKNVNIAILRRIYHSAIRIKNAVLVVLDDYTITALVRSPDFIVSRFNNPLSGCVNQAQVTIFIRHYTISIVEEVIHATLI